TWGKGRGVARVQRLSQGAKAAESPNNVGGRRAHPPMVEREWDLKVNRKERLLARLSALAATADVEKVRARGHRFDDSLTLPVVIEDRLEGVNSTSEVLEVLRTLGLGEDVVRSKDGIRVRAGRGKMRGRRYRMPRSLLIVVSDHQAALVRGARNLPGVEVAYAERLNPGLLAPGGLPGRLTVFSESAFKRVGEW
ncbi:MAG: 50S ribosomal protein L4, partial [Methanomassiliicoccales archaeon]|nr:50S ribosomal protein L4 [Methanomassiliicoccales archaeon]